MGERSFGMGMDGGFYGWMDGWSDILSLSHPRQIHSLYFVLSPAVDFSSFFLLFATYLRSMYYTNYSIMAERREKKKKGPWRAPKRTRISEFHGECECLCVLIIFINNFKDMSKCLNMPWHTIFCYYLLPCLSII